MNNDKTRPLDEIKEAIDGLDRNETRSLRQYLAESENRKSKKMKYLLKTGTKVIVWDPRCEIEQSGKVVKVNQTRAVIDIEGDRYNVPFELISLTKEAA